MAQSCSYLFVYGTLLDKQNEFGAYLNANCTFYADARFKGRLYDIGEYPGAVISSESENYVNGKVYYVKNAAELFKQLDYYEGFGPDEEQPNLFTRQLISAEVAVEAIECWIYLYNLPVERLRLIESGTYITR